MIQTKEELFLAELGINTKEEIELAYGAKIKLNVLLKKYVTKQLLTHNVRSSSIIPYPFKIKCVRMTEHRPYIEVGKTYEAVHPHDTRDDYFAVKGDLDTIAFYRKDWFEII